MIEYLFWICPSCKELMMQPATMKKEKYCSDCKPKKPKRGPGR